MLIKKLPLPLIPVMKKSISQWHFMKKINIIHSSIHNIVVTLMLGSLCAVDFLARCAAHLRPSYLRSQLVGGFSSQDEANTSYKPVTSRFEHIHCSLCKSLTPEEWFRTMLAIYFRKMNRVSG